jgi:CubicO group peptidase (beta-lactamase class C family)
MTLALVASLLLLAPDVRAKVDAVFAAYDRSDSPGCVLGIYRDGAMDYARGYGMADLERGLSLGPASVLDLGSAGKQFTAFAIHLLAAEGRLSLDDDVRRHLPELPAYGRPITIRHLLHHTSGLRDYLGLLDLAGFKEQDLTTDEDALGLIVRQKAANFPAGEDHLYSNTGYFLLSVIVKRASGRSLRDFAAERVFSPLGMRHTQYNDRHDRLIPGRALGYAAGEGGGFVLSMSDFEQTGDGGVLASVEDLLLWDRNFYEPRVGTAAMVADMQKPGALASGRPLEYASGLRIAPYRGLPTVSHGGSWAGYRAQLLRFPGERLSVACLCNLASAEPTALALSVADLLLEGRLQPAAAPSPEPARKAPEKPASPIADAAAFAGTYVSEEIGETPIVLAVDAGTLVVRHRVLPRGPIVPLRPDTVALEGYYTFRFFRKDGRVDGFHLDMGRVKGLLYRRVH